MGTLVIFLQFNYLTSHSLGYDDYNLITIGKYPLTRNEAALFKEVLMRNADIIDVAPKSAGNNNNTIKLSGNKLILRCGPIQLAVAELRSIIFLD